MELKERVDCLFKKMPHLDKLYRFLRLYIRIEYALKESGYLKQSSCRDGSSHRNANAEGATPNWDKFARELDSKLAEQPTLQEALSRFATNPPRKQIVSDYGLGWSCSTPQCQTNQDILGLVRRVRNNALHGGKVPFDESRDTQLLEDSENILLAALELNERVRRAFFNPEIHLTS